MARRQVDVQVFPAFRGKVSPLWLRRVARRALDVAYQDRSCELALVLADDGTVCALNRDYRGLDQVTDVLAFSFAHPGQWEGAGEALAGRNGNTPFVTPPDAPEGLGDVVISFPQALRQAKQHGQPVDRELAALVVHGVLHLLGHDHRQPDEERVMKAQEAAALSRLF